MVIIVSAKILVQAWILSEAGRSGCDHICQGNTSRKCCCWFWWTNCMIWIDYSIFGICFKIIKIINIYWKFHGLFAAQCDYWSSWWRCVSFADSFIWEGIAGLLYPNFSNSTNERSYLISKTRWNVVMLKSNFFDYVVPFILIFFVFCCEGSTSLQLPSYLSICFLQR